MTEKEATGLEIAVIGMAGRFPGAGSVSEFWENIKNGVESITFFSDEQLKETGVDPPLLENPDFVRAKGVLEGIEFFEPLFFNFTPNEAEIMDPQLRVFLECSWEALENAGYDPGRYDGAIGLYSGNAPNHYWVTKTMFNSKYYLFGQFKADLLNTQFSTWVSYHLNLKGPSLTIRTACSTSLVTIHTACLALLSSECDMALAGGVAIGLPQVSGYLYQEGMVGSPDGHCRAFDAGAKGTVSGNGAAVVVLKRLEDALEDGDYIYALVKGTSINNDGIRKVGFTAPSVEGQSEVIRAAYLMAEVEPQTVNYIETHGTGTELGDPVEIEALNMVFNAAEKGSIPIGSVKTNVGHLDAAAGAAGFIKAVMTLKDRRVPPNLHFTSPNPQIDFKNSPFFVNTRLVDLETPKTGNPLRAGVSSFGLGGTNVHAVLEEWSPRSPLYREQEGGPVSRDYQLVLLSAMTKTALETLTANMVDYFKENPGINLADAVYTLQVGRKSLPFKRMTLISTGNEVGATDALTVHAKKIKTFYSRVRERPVIFLLSGQGSQYVAMGRDLYRKETYFRETVDRCFEIVNPLVGSDLKEVLYPNPASEPIDPATVSEDIHRTELTQPVVFIFEYALAKLLMKWGINPRAMIGYSMGEYVAACLSGVFSLEDALKLVTVRGQLMKQTPDAAMLSVPLPEEELAPLLEGNSEVSLAIVNGLSCVVTGTAGAVEAFENRMREKRLLCAPINMGRAVHSPLMETVRETFENRVGEVTLNAPQIPYISNVGGNWITVEEAVDPGYWGKHLCNTVRFSDGIKELLKMENAVFIEIGPGRVLSNIVRQLSPPGKKGGYKIVNTVKHQQEEDITDDYFLLSKVGEIWLYGVSIDWSEFYAGEKRHRIPLPTYPFERRRYWSDEDPFKKLAQLLQAPEGRSLREELREMSSTPEPPPSPEVEPYEYEYEEEGYEAPRDELEQTIARLWQDFLGFERIGVNDNFFDINGDSLTATQLITRLQQIYPVEISLQLFFEDPTIAHLAVVIKELLVERVKELSEEELEELAGSM
ncbi:MAG: acyltransferase domain-containing protein [bacterium]|nr:acyltransferase domain-containing protein [bacterium]